MLEWGFMDKLARWINQSMFIMPLMFLPTRACNLDEGSAVDTFALCTSNRLLFFSRSTATFVVHAESNVQFSSSRDAKVFGIAPAAVTA